MSAPTNPDRKQRCGRTALQSVPIAAIAAILAHPALGLDPEVAVVVATTLAPLVGGALSWVQYKISPPKEG